MRVLVWLAVFAAILVNCGTRGDVIENSVPEYEYDAIGSNITEEELIKILEEMDYVMPDNITAQGISDLLDLITADNDAAGVVDYDYKISGGDAVVGESTETEVDEDFVYPDIDYQEKEVETTDEDTKESIEDILEDDETEIVWIPVVVEYDYEIVETKDILEIFEDADTQLDYQEDQTYQLFVQKALDTSVQFESIYQEQRIFNIILLSGVSLICLIVMFGLISLAISIFNRSHSTNPTMPDGNVKVVKTGGILKSYAKIPVEVKNMLPSNVAYKQLYDV
eukprot:TRINITY_DN32981_c0_g1_i1.p1 TRINITY_DN32981_c0_g1~~TRINITY_DN32981_c0_g1_i1.p1  ORF type:complete len:281 (+),score=99.62 TRINITY_DN32981_c0_g1_i1:45-887(+)